MPNPKLFDEWSGISYFKVEQVCIESKSARSIAVSIGAKQMSYWATEPIGKSNNLAGDRFRLLQFPGLKLRQLLFDFITHNLAVHHKMLVMGTNS